MNYLTFEKACKTISESGKTLYLDSCNTCYYISISLVDKDRYELLKCSTTYRISDKVIRRLKETFGYSYAFGGTIISWLFLFLLKS